MKLSLQYLGLVRLYSLVDLILILLATHPTAGHFWGALALWLGFLAILEAYHRHPYRPPVPHFIWVVLFLIGFILVGTLYSVLFITLSFFYTLKDHPRWGVVSPLFRGLQVVVLGSALLSPGNPLVWLAGGLTMLRNILGDVRDAGKDRKEKMRTIPVLLGQKHNVPYIHLVGVLLTSAAWIYLGGLPFYYLLVAWVIEVATYNLTAR